MEKSEKYTLSLTDLKKIGKGCVLALIGAVLTYLTDLIPNVDFGTFTPVVVAAWSVLANIVRKFLTNQTMESSTESENLNNH
jgi:hypothetical protein